MFISRRNTNNNNNLNCNSENFPSKSTANIPRKQSCKNSISTLSKAEREKVIEIEDAPMDEKKYNKKSHSNKKLFYTSNYNTEKNYDKVSNMDNISSNCLKNFNVDKDFVYDKSLARSSLNFTRSLSQSSSNINRSGNFSTKNNKPLTTTSKKRMNKLPPERQSEGKALNNIQTPSQKHKSHNSQDLHSKTNVNNKSNYSESIKGSNNSSSKARNLNRKSISNRNNIDLNINSHISRNSREDLKFKSLNNLINTYTNNNTNPNTNSNYPSSSNNNKNNNNKYINTKLVNNYNSNIDMNCNKDYNTDYYNYANNNINISNNNFSKNTNNYYSNNGIANPNADNNFNLYDNSKTLFNKPSNYKSLNQRLNLIAKNRKLNNMPLKVEYRTRTGKDKEKTDFNTNDVVGFNNCLVSQTNKNYCENSSNISNAVISTVNKQTNNFDICNLNDHTESMNISFSNIINTNSEFIPPCLITQENNFKQVKKFNRRFSGINNSNNNNINSSNSNMIANASKNYNNNNNSNNNIKSKDPVNMVFYFNNYILTNQSKNTLEENNSLAETINNNSFSKLSFINYKNEENLIQPLENNSNNNSNFMAPCAKQQQNSDFNSNPHSLAVANNDWRFSYKSAMESRAKINNFNKCNNTNNRFENNNKKNNSNYKTNYNITNTVQNPDTSSTIANSNTNKIYSNFNKYQSQDNQFSINIDGLNIHEDMNAKYLQLISTSKQGKTSNINNPENIKSKNNKISNTSNTNYINIIANNSYSSKNSFINIPNNKNNINNTIKNKTFSVLNSIEDFSSFAVDDKNNLEPKQLENSLLYDIVSKYSGISMKKINYRIVKSQRNMDINYKKGKGKFYIFFIY